ncbi:Major phosphate-irrepressible acid phosphatase [Brevundimonas sp. NIBR10]|uniref:phosphatase PAP2 family protein n=1 Tax=Brevundimonas sp. NIBR10 TaxID=3015997 RepID=UPI0022F191D4|nr:phosphatase PAP2 family protein [Brevundimonas sp. NIBR10]WGM46134.1 Major phosphate-irrepressible acid phosphatase [Brevundimonas sp. NIBR10]
MRGSPAVSAAALAVTALLAGCSSTPFGAPVASAVAAPAAMSAPAHAGGYLAVERVEALAGSVPAPFADSSAEQAADRALSDRYRAYEGGDRWLLATAHAELSPRLAAQHFDCALNARFASAPTPRLTALFDKVLKDANGAAELAKTRVFRPRPVGVDPSRAACTTVSAAGRASASYPSGSATVGSAYGEAMAALDPAHAAAAREIGHQIAVSRVVCGMHYPADAAAGEVLGRAVFAQIAATPAFQADLEAARAELAAVRATGLTNPGCAAERAALALPLP